MVTLSVQEALSEVLAGASALAAEEVGLDQLSGRVAAKDVRAGMDQPPFPASAMDGYAVRFEDAQQGSSLTVIGETPAGAPFAGVLGAGQAVRIFTGGVVPQGADHIVIQEDVDRVGDVITIAEAQPEARHIRAAGIDFKNGDLLVRRGTVLHAAHGAILAAANAPKAAVVRRPRVALFSNGDELKEPGEVLKAGEIVNSNHYALSALIRDWGGEPVYLGRAHDSADAAAEMFARAKQADIVVPVGGASVGDYDFVRGAFELAGGYMHFAKIAMRPGKPTWFGRLGEARVLGLPGNPASALVTAALFLQPLVKRMAGEHGNDMRPSRARLGASLGPSGSRETFLRATAVPGADGALVATAAVNQDSSLLSPFAVANVLIKRAALSDGVHAGEDVEIFWLR